MHSVMNIDNNIVLSLCNVINITGLALILAMYKYIKVTAMVHRVADCQTRLK